MSRAQQHLGTGILTALGTFLVAVIVGEGLLSLLMGSSWRRLIGAQREAPSEPLVQTDAERYRAAAQTPGPFRATEDPLVGYAFKANHRVEYTEGELSIAFESDALGLRPRPGGPPPAEAFHVVVLGDSVAFGQGLAAEETVAAQLERVLGETRATEERVVACSTVAVPSWNARNAVRFLLDHLETLDPDLVVYLAVANDLEDTYGTNEAGQRRETSDPAVPHPKLQFRPEWGFVRQRSNELRAAGIEPDEARGGPEVSWVGLTESSRWRMDDLVQSLVRLRARLASRGAELWLAFHEQSDFQRRVETELNRARAGVRIVPLLDVMKAVDTLGVDPHPNAETTRTFGLWLAEELCRAGRVARAATLPGVGSLHADRRARPREAGELERWDEEYRRGVVGSLRRVIACRTLEGVLQVYGGLNLDDSLAPEFAAVLPGGRALRVSLEALEGGGPQPLGIRVHADERVLGVIEVQAKGGVERVFALPAEIAAKDAFELRLESLDWVTVKVKGKSWVASARLVEVESLAR